MPRKRRESKRRSVGVLTARQEWELIMGPAGQCGCARPDIGEGPPCDTFCGVSAFEDAEHREAAWWAHREILHHEGPHSNGLRAWGWWHYESASHCRHRPRCPIPPGRFGRKEWLAYHGLLDPAEEAKALASAGLGGPYAEIADAVRTGIDRREAEK